jgi:hypothetical protein
MAYARLQYARKHFPRPRTAAHHAILVLHHAVRAALPQGVGPMRSSSASAAVLALRVLLGRSDPRVRVTSRRLSLPSAGRQPVASLAAGLADGRGVRAGAEDPK